MQKSIKGVNDTKPWWRELITPAVGIIGVAVGVALTYWSAKLMWEVQAKTTERGNLLSKRIEIAERFAVLSSSSPYVADLFRAYVANAEKVTRNDTAAIEKKLVYGEKLAKYAAEYYILRLAVGVYFGSEARKELIELEGNRKEFIPDWSNFREYHHKLESMLWTEIINSTEARAREISTE